MLEIPYTQLSEDALRGVLEEFATRGGFEEDMSIDKRVEQLNSMLKKGKAKIIFDPDEGTTNLVPHHA
jgi:uncharacterized protein